MFRHWRTRSLPDLPNEILLQIVHFVGEQAHLPRRYRVLYNLTLVCQRLRDFSFPLLERDLFFTSSRQFLRVVDHWERAKLSADVQHEKLIRSIWIGDPGNDRGASCDLLSWGNCMHQSPFRNLTSFACVDALANSSVLDKLSESPFLSSLTIVWGHRDLDLHKFKNLQSLRIYVEGTRSLPLPYPLSLRDSSLDTLTKLVIHDTRACQWSRCLFWRGTLMFPNLRVLRLDESAVAPEDIFAFIQIHSTLREVSVSMCEEHAPVRLEMLKKLIDGTGTWSDVVYEDEAVDGETVNEVMSPCAQWGDEHEFALHYKDEFPDAHIQFDLFSFTREPITETATQWRSSRGSAAPRYKATALAFRAMDQERWQALGMPVAYIPDILQIAKEHFPDVEELRVSCDTPCWDGNYTTFMKKVATGVQDLKHLRKLAISWTIPDEWTWNGPLHPLLLEENFLQLDAVVPPTERCSDPADSEPDADEDDDWVGKGHSLDELRGLYVDEFVDNLVKELRDIHGSEGVDTRDESLYVRTWEAHNEPRVARAMRRIAESCATLEQIDWYPTGMDSMAETTRWRWTVHRDRQGGVRLVSGNLTWKGCTRDPWAAMHVLLGEELEYEEGVHQRRW